MNRLKDKRVQAIIAVGLMLIAAVMVIGNIYLYIVSILGVLFILTNLYSKKKICRNADHLFSTIDRNYDVLIIGENCDIDCSVKKVIRFCSPNRSMLASYELVRRLYSLVDEENGKIVICCREKLIESKNITALDVPYLHEMQLAKYGIGRARIKKFLPLLFAPIDTLLYLIGIKRKVTTIGHPIPDYLLDFCQNRIKNIEVVLTK